MRNADGQGKCGEVGRVAAWFRVGIAGTALAVALSGCHLGTPAGNPLAGGPPPLENPLFVPAVDRELLWSQVVDTVDNYFKIQREDRVRQVGDALLEGRIDTFPQDGATVLEPWRKDSTPGFEKWHATFQSLRRRATVRVLPATGGYLVEVNVAKELEDLDRPEHAAVGRSVTPQDSLADAPETKFAAGERVSLGWIPLGRDVSLEQRILAEIRARTTP